MNNLKRLGKNTLIIFLGSIGSKLIGFIMLPFYTRWLTVSDYGLTDVISVYVTLLFSLVTCCIGDALFIFPKGKNKEKQITYFSSGGLFVIGMYGITGIIFLIVNNMNIPQNSFTSNIGLIYFMLGSQILQQLIQQFTRSIDKLLVYSITGIITTASIAISAFWLVPHWGILGFIISIILSNIIGAIYSLIASKAYTYFSLRKIKLGFLHEMLFYSIPLIPNGIMWWLVSAMNRPLMEKYLGLHDIGIFAVANKFPSILAMIFTIFSMSWQISVLEEFGKEDYNQFFNKVFKAVIITLSMVLLTITLLSKPLIMLFTTQDYIEAWRFIPLLTLGVLFSSISALVATNFSATKESKYYFYSSIWGAITAIITNSILIPTMEIWGATISTIVSFLVMCLSRIKYAMKYIKITNPSFYIKILILLLLNITVYTYEYHFIAILSSFITIVYLYKNIGWNFSEMIKNKLTKK